VIALNIYKELGKRIHEIRIKSNITQEKLAELSGVSSNFISQIERGRNKCSLETINSLSVAMNTPLSELFNFSLPNPTSKDSFTKRIEIMLKNLSGKDKNLVMDITEDTYNKIVRHNKK
jgi:transcriptional regulator with XRE-family HTH domain